MRKTLSLGNAVLCCPLARAGQSFLAFRGREKGSRHPVVFPAEQHGHRHSRAVANSSFAAGHRPRILDRRRVVQQRNQLANVVGCGSIGQTDQCLFAEVRECNSESESRASELQHDSVALRTSAGRLGDENRQSLCEINGNNPWPVIDRPRSSHATLVG